MRYKIPTGLTHFEVRQENKQLVIIFEPEFSNNELIELTKKDNGEVYVGYVKNIESDCLLVEHILCNETYADSIWFMKKLYNIRRCSKLNIEEYNNICHKHGYEIKDGKKIRYSKSIKYDFVEAKKDYKILELEAEIIELKKKIYKLEKLIN